MESRYREIPDRLNRNGHRRGAPAQLVAALPRALPFLALARPRPNRDGDVEMLAGTRTVHRFVDAAGDSARLRWHLVEAREGEPVVFLHGVPGSWYDWHHQIADLARDHRVVAIVLKGLGQTQNTPGDYRPAGIAEQLVALFDVLQLERVNLVAHGRGTVVADHLGAAHPFRVRRYVRGQQHLYHFSEALESNESWFATPLGSRLLRTPSLLVSGMYGERCRHPVSRSALRRIVREWSHPGVGAAAARHFNSSSLRQEWTDRRSALMAHWRFPVLVVQGEHDPWQPREFYEGIEGTMPDARVELLDAGFAFALENPAQTTRVLRDFLAT